MISPKSPIFIVSTGRSGSQMLARVLGQHPGVLALHEPKPRLNTEAYLKWSGIREAEYTRYRLRDCRQDTISQINRDNGLTYVESSLFMSHFVSELDDMFDAKFVHLYRNPRNFALSAVRKGWYSKRERTLKAQAVALLRRHLHMRIGNEWVDHKLSPPRSLSHPLDKALWLWNEVNRTILDSFAGLPAEKTFSMQLENFDASVLRALHQFIGIEINEALLESMVQTASRRPNRTRQHIKERDDLVWDPARDDALNALAGLTARRLGYS